MSTKKTDAAVSLMALASLGLSSVLGPDLWIPDLLIMAFTELLLLFGWRHAPLSRPLCLLVLLLQAGVLLVPLWPLVAGAALAILFMASRRIHELAPLPETCARGRVPLGLTLLASAVTPVGLLGWWILLRPDLSDIRATYVPDLPLPLLLVGGALFVLANASFEEIIWRGVLQSQLGALLPPAWAVLVQALSFGLVHAHGFPRGASGVALAGGWALLLGLLRLRSGGLLAPILAHFVADAVIVGIVLGLG